MIQASAATGGRLTLDCPDETCGWFVSTADPMFPEHRGEHLAASALRVHLEDEHPDLLEDET